MKSLFTPKQQELATIILENNHLSPFRELYSTEVKELAIIWAYYSGKIEGNSYSFVETQTLLKDGITSPKRYEDAQELKNLYNTFIAEAEYIKKGGNIEIDENLIFKVHSTFMNNLISDSERGSLRTRDVCISGILYKPTGNYLEIKQKLADILSQQEQIKNPLERAIYLHCNIAKLQPFIDGNKRTSRLLESIVLMNSNIIPIFSTKNQVIDEYRKGLLYFYETGDYSAYVDFVLTQKLNYLQQFAKHDLTEKA